MTGTENTYLSPGKFIDSEHPAVVQLAASIIDPAASDRDNAIRLYYRVRDSIRYNPYGFQMTPESFLASTTLRAGEGWCVPKAIVLAALCRSAGIPARLGFADVRNHLSTERLRQAMGTDIFYFHGYTSILLDGKWVKATPAFNIELCEKFGLLPLEFDGEHDSLYHAFDSTGNRHMEYVHERGEHADLPYGELLRVFSQHYPGTLLAGATDSNNPSAASWAADVARETHGGRG